MKELHSKSFENFNFDLQYYGENTEGGYKERLATGWVPGQEIFLGPVWNFEIRVSGRVPGFILKFSG